MSMATEGVLKYLESTNRPYSANDIVQNMHKEFGKTAVQKALDDLVSQGKVLEKAYGKQKIYCVRQPEDKNTGEADLTDLDSEINKVGQNLKSVEHQVKESESILRELLATPKTGEAKAQLSELEGKVEALRIKLTQLSENTVVISVEERSKIKQQHEQLLREYRKRKRICMDIVNEIMETYPKTKKVLMEEIGIETDEDVKMPPVQAC